MVTIPYLRASTQAVRLDQQRLAVFDYYARKQRLTVDEFVETKRSSQRVTPEPRTDAEDRGTAAGRPSSAANFRAWAEALASSFMSLNP